MDLALSRTGDYGIRAAVVLADGARHKGGDIAARANIPPSFVPQVLGHLTRSGLVVSQAGQSGGYSLAGDAANITLLQLLEALEGPVRSTRCILRNAPCDELGHCGVHTPWTAAQEAFRRELAATTLSSLAT